MIEMPIRPTLDIMSTGHNISGAGLLTPLGVGTIGARVAKLAMCWCGGGDCRSGDYNFVEWVLSRLVFPWLNVMSFICWLCVGMDRDKT